MTHAAGIIRIDDFRFNDNKIDFDKLIGKECLFNSPMEVWDDFELHPEDYLPMGSEGSLQKSIWINPDKSSVAAYTVSIFGDLRDYDTPEVIEQWFKDKCKSVWVRSAVITIECGNGKCITYTYSEDEEQ